MKNQVLILGGGIAGLTTAIALQHKNIDFMVYEAVPEIKAIGSGISLAGNAMQALGKLNVADDVKARGHLITSMIIQDEKGKYLSALDTRKFIEEHGMYNVAIHRGDLHEVLLKNIPAEKMVTGKKVETIHETADGVVVTFADGSEQRGVAVVVADGIHSVVRKQLLPESQPRYSGYTCWRGVTANKWGINHQAVETWGPAGRLGYVPIGNNNVYWFACKNAPQRDERMKNFTISDLIKNFNGYAHPIPEIISSTPSENLIWSDISDLEPISRFAFNRVLLIGDAAHATTPNLGQGACLGIEDALVVADELSRNADPVAAFQSFEAKRLERAHFIVNTSYRLGKIAQVENKILAAIRNFVVKLTPQRVNEKQVARVLNIA
ncbi:MAG: FAD-dependent monooxygenase [Cyclobacteriaceae bacterium]|nr:FAD-dependent monooxygenase [Cyclobacteriaceae bacterium]MBX2958199.1 FAD-dependent monooxygenase [Cyclobacteriaceae bacterium]